MHQLPIDTELFV